MSETSPPAPDDISPQQRRDFERYYKERDEWVKAMLDAERSYDTLLVTISTLALGASLTKDWAPAKGGPGDAFLVTAWIAFALCLLLSLGHRFATHYTHKKWIEVCDQHFGSWSDDVWTRCDKDYEKIPLIRFVEWVKIAAGIAVAVGVISSFCLLVSMRSADTAVAKQPPIQQTFNVYAATTQPTTQGISP